MQLAEAAPERLMLLDRDLLVAEEDNEVVEQRLMILFELADC